MLGPMDVRIRSASLEDMSHVVRHRRAMFEEIGFRDPAVLERVESLSRDYFRKALPTGAYRGWIREDEMGKVLGGGGIVISCWPGYPGERHAKRAWILNMYTEPEARHHGVARRLVQTMLDWCRREGFSGVSLHASSAGRPLYESFGFQPTNEMALSLG